MTAEILDAAWVASEARRLSNWGRWGPDDQLGAWNLVTPAKVVEAAACVRRGAVFSLALPFGSSGPSTGTGGRTNPQHFMHMSGTDIAAGMQDKLFAGEVGFTDDSVLMNLSCSTQWDGFAHVFHQGRGYNDAPAATVSSAGARRNSITALKDRIVTRAVLIDVPASKGLSWCEPGEAIQPADLDFALAWAGVEVRPGDAILLRTGHLAQVRAGSGWGRYAGSGPAPGLGARCAGWLAARDIAAIACDTWGLEVLPYETPDTVAPLHQIILTHCGITIGEMFDLEALAADCAVDRVYEAMLVAPVLPIERAVNTPVNPQAIK